MLPSGALKALLGVLPNSAVHANGLLGMATLRSVEACQISINRSLGHRVRRSALTIRKANPVNVKTRYGLASLDCSRSGGWGQRTGRRWIYSTLNTPRSVGPLR